MTTTTSTGQTTLDTIRVQDNLILNYIGRKLRKRQYPSLKNVQSRFKDLRLSTTQIEDVCVLNGYRVQDLAGRKPSQAIIYI